MANASGGVDDDQTDVVNVKAPNRDQRLRDARPVHLEPEEVDVRLPLRRRDQCLAAAAANLDDQGRRPAERGCDVEFECRVH